MCIRDRSPPASLREREALWHARDIEAALWALEQWAKFPVDAVPRPVILTSPSIRPEEGFATTQAKLGFLHGQIVAAAGVPELPVQAMKARGLPVPPNREVSPLRVAGAVLSEAPFRTDRGIRVLPAWRMDAEDKMCIRDRR